MGPADRSRPEDRRVAGRRGDAYRVPNETLPQSSGGESSKLLTFYYHSVFFLAAALLGMHALLYFATSQGVESGLLLLGVEASLAILGVIGAELERSRKRNPSGAFLATLGILQTALCVWTGGLASPYFVLVAATCVFAGQALTTARAAYVTTFLVCAYVAGVRFVATRTPMPEAEFVTAITMHVTFMLLATTLSLRIASRHNLTFDTLSGQSILDPLTGIPNRRGFLKKMEEAIPRAERFAWPITLMILDLDFFKKVNDQHGHAVGDQVLCEVAQILRDYQGLDTQMARIGGEEFAVAAIAEPHSGRELADRLVKAFRIHGWERIRPGLKVRVSIGVAVLPIRAGEPSALIRELMERADKALYRAKQGGRDRYEFADETVHAGLSSA
jgi:diguanylate cyclase (GGDEF)-like protein